MRRVVVLEFNELTPRLMSRFIAEGHLPHFARLRAESEVYTTRAKEEPPALEPWIQWVNVHSGLDYAEHGIFNLDEGHKLGPRNVWDVVAAAGRRVLVCGSMNIRYELPVDGVMIPDPWTSAVAPHPANVEPYFRFVQKNVTEYTRDRVPLGLADYVGFLGFMLSHGLSLGTASAIVRQLFRERSSGERWRRATLLDRLQYDVFAWYYRRLRPAFATFFANSTAHFQHLYWRNLEPEVFASRPSPAEQAEYASAVLFGYQEMDRLVGRFFDLCGDEATLVLCTALSQQPCLKYEESGGKIWYRPHDFSKLLNFAAVTAPVRVAPAMAEEFHVYCEDAADRDSVEQRLRALRVGDRPALRVKPHEGGFMAGCGLFAPVSAKAMVVRPDTGAAMRFFDLFYRVEGVKSGMHHPDGLLWVRTPARQHLEAEGTVPLEAIAPTILRWLDLEPPAHMKGRPFSRAESVVRPSPTAPAPAASMRPAVSSPATTTAAVHEPDVHAELALLGVEPSPAFVGTQEGDGRAERLNRTRKEQKLRHWFLLQLKTLLTLQPTRQTGLDGPGGS